MNEEEFKKAASENGYRYSEKSFRFDMKRLEHELEQILREISEMKNYCIKKTKNVKKVHFSIFKGENGRIRALRTRDDGKKEYMTEKELDRIHETAQKNYYLSVLDKLEKEEKALIKLLDFHRKNKLTESLESSDLSVPFNQVIAPLVLPNKEIGEKWSLEEFIQSNEYSYELKHQTLNGNIVRSKSEVLLDNTWMRRGYYYRYEMRHYLEGYGEVYPDFTVFDPKTGKIFIFEHFGMIDDPEYVMKNLSKMIAYAENGYYLNENLFISYESGKEPLTQAKIDRIIDRIEQKLRGCA